MLLLLLLLMESSKVLPYYTLNYVKKYDSATFCCACNNIPLGNTVAAI